VLESGRGGVIAAVAHNPCGVASTNQALTADVLDRMLNRGENVLGRAVFAAKCSMIARNPTDDNLYGPAVLWTLFGDPALRVRWGRTTGVGESRTDHCRLQTAELRLQIVGSPARGAVRLRCGAAGRLAVFDACGRQAWSGPVEPGEVQLEAGQLAPGVYTARLSAQGRAAAQGFAVTR
jgi:hypothetical protein